MPTKRLKRYHNPENPSNSFELYLLLPPEDRMHIIDRMRPIDRIRYTRCSKKSHAEAERSLYYVYGLEYRGVDEDHVRIKVLYEPCERVDKYEGEDEDEDGDEAGDEDEVEGGNEDGVEAGDEDEVEVEDIDEGGDEAKVEVEGIDDGGEEDEIESGNEDVNEAGDDGEVEGGDEHEVEIEGIDDGGEEDEIESGKEDGNEAGDDGEVKGGDEHEVEIEGIDDDGEEDEIESGKEDGNEAGDEDEVEAGDEAEGSDEDKVEGGDEAEVKGDDGDEPEFEAGDEDGVEGGDKDEIESGSEDENEAGDDEEVEVESETGDEDEVKAGDEAKVEGGDEYEVEVEYEGGDEPEHEVDYEHEYEYENEGEFKKMKDEIRIDGFVLEFKIENGVKVMKYLDFQNKEFDRTELCSSTDLVQLSVEKFNTMLQKWQHMIEQLIIRREPDFELKHGLQNLLSGIKCFPRLKILKIHYESDALQYLSKLRKRLNKFAYFEKIDYETLVKYQIVNVPQELFLSGFEPTYEEFLQMPSPIIYSRIGSITESQIFSFIQLWKNGVTGKQWADYSWCFEDSNFDTRKLLELFGKEEDESKSILFIEHNFDKEKRAVLSFTDDELFFEFGDDHLYADIDPTKVYE